MISSGITLSVLVNGKPITEYTHENAVYVEGRAGSNYELLIRNNNYYRVEAVVSVDGLSVLDGDEARPESRGYLIDPHSSIKIPGWKLDNANAAQFAFSGKDASYATQMSDGKTRNNGVIGVLAYRERTVFLAASQPINTVYGYPPYSNPQWSATATPDAVRAGMNTRSFTIQSSGYNACDGTIGGNIYMASSSAAPAQEQTSVLRGTEQTLGTAFGAQTAFNTRQVSFTRGDMLTVMSIYYDSLKGLRARGVPVMRTRKAQYRQQPQAFAGLTGCKPPPGWQG